MAELEQRELEAISLADLDIRTQQLVGRVTESKAPLWVTEDGQPVAVLINACEYNLLQRRLILLEKVNAAERDFADGRVHTPEEVDALLNQWLSDD